MRGVGVLKQRARLIRVEGEDADAGPRADKQLSAVDRERARQCRMDALCDRLGGGRQPARPFRGLRIAHVEVGQQHQELVRAVARDDVARPRNPDQPLGDAAEQFVGGVVTEAAVHQSEALEVDVDQSDRDTPSACAREGRLELMLERTARAQPGQRVAFGCDAAGGQHRLAHEASEARGPLRPETGDCHLDRKPAAVAASGDHARGARTDLFVRLLEQKLECPPLAGAHVGGYEEVDELATLGLGPVPAEGALGGRVHADDAVLVVDGNDRVRNRVDDRGVQLLLCEWRPCPTSLPPAGLAALGKLHPLPRLLSKHTGSLCEHQGSEKPE